MYNLINWVIALAGILALAAGVIFVLLLRKILSKRMVTVSSSDLEWYRPLERLLDPSDLQFIRACGGLNEKRIRKLRAERRAIFRGYLRSLVRDYRGTELALHRALVHSPQDRPELASTLLRQKVAFYRYWVAVECKLVLHACGFDNAGRVDVMENLHELMGQLRQMSVAYEVSC
jgi:hypothetical protein